MFMYRGWLWSPPERFLMTVPEILTWARVALESFGLYNFLMVIVMIMVIGALLRAIFGGR